MLAETLQKEIEDYCEKAGISPSTFGVRALGNSRIMERLQRRAEREINEAERIRTYIRENPPKPRGAVA